jgi:hypothetical protein
MSTEVHLDDITFARAKQLAETHNVSVEQMISQAIERIAGATDHSVNGHSIIGTCSDCAELLDQIVEEAYQIRETTPFRLKPE